MNAPLHDIDHSTMIRGAFAFCGPRGMIRSDGGHTPVAPGKGDTLEERLAHAFAGAGSGAIIGGALPFSRDQHDHLWCAERLRQCRTIPSSARVTVAGCAMRADPARLDYAASVAKALEILQQEARQQDGLRKVVLARTLAIDAGTPIPLDALLSRLADDASVTAFQVALPSEGGLRALVGATPELLLEKRGRRILSNPLAGSARRSSDTVADAQSCAGLARSEKDMREHALVVEYILDTLAPFCHRLESPDGTRLTCTDSMWHLHTRIGGELRDETVPAPVLASALHPTPAVCGLPCQRAVQLIEELEPVARDFYAGAVGWCDPRGDGAWYVAIRCADICGQEARLYAGAGIVEGSNPMAEAAETGNKFAAMLTAFGLPADAAMAD